MTPEQIAEHAPIVWPIIVVAIVGLAAIVTATVAALGYIRREAKNVAEAVAGHMADELGVQMMTHKTEIATWRESMEDWKRSFHTSIKELRVEAHENGKRLAGLEQVAYSMRRQLESMEEERRMRHERDKKHEEEG